MRVSKFLKINNISTDRFLNLLNSSEWYESKWRFDSFGLNSNMTNEQLSFLQSLLNKSNEDDLIRQVELKKNDETNLVKQINSDSFYNERFYGGKPPIEIPENLNQNLQKSIIAFLNVVLLITYNIERNYSNSNDYFSSVNKKKVNLLDEKEIIKYHRRLLRSDKLKKNNWEIISMIHQNMEGYKIFYLVSKIHEKSKQPFDAAVLLLKYRKIYFSRLHKIKLATYIPYKKLIDERENNHLITSSNSVYTFSHPFRN